MSADLLTTHERRLGPYLLKQPLGSGGTAQVYRAWKENPTQRPLPCVVKFPLHRYAADEEGSRIFIHEARLSLMMGPHPNIVYVIDVGEYHSMPFIVMEYVDGIDLDMLVKRLRDRKKRLDLASIYCIFTAVAMGLHHAHFDAVDAGRPVCVVHRDVKPANILVTRRGFVKLADFGIGVALDEGTSGTHMRGTARYMSPEHLDCVACPEMDVYSLGVVIWELIEGRPFREGLEKAQIFHAIMRGTIPPIHNHSCPSQLERLVYACLHPDRRQRPSAADILLSLKHCPGYTTDVSFLAGELAALMGRTPSSGTTDPHFVATPDLVATMAVLELSAKAEAANSPKSMRSRDASRPVVEVGQDTEGREPDAPREPRPRQANEHLPMQAAVATRVASAGRGEAPVRAPACSSVGSAEQGDASVRVPVCSSVGSAGQGDASVRAPMCSGTESAGQGEAPAQPFVPSSTVPSGQKEPRAQEQGAPRTRSPVLAETPAPSTPSRSEPRSTGTVDTSATTKKTKKPRGSSSGANTLPTLVALWTLSLALLSAAMAHILDDLAQAHPQHTPTRGSGEQARHP